MEDVSPPRIDPINFPDKGADYVKVPFFLLSLLSINSEVFFLFTLSFISQEAMHGFSWLDRADLHAGFKMYQACLN